jgi:hypothetical protein
MAGKKIGGGLDGYRCGVFFELGYDVRPPVEKKLLG